MREGGYRVATNQLLRDTNLVPTSPTDQRQFEVVAYNGPLYHGNVLCIDATLVSPLDSSGRPHPRADIEDGICLQRAEARKLSLIHI